MTRTLALLAAAISLAACVTTSEHVLTGTPRPGYAGEVKIAMAGTAVSGEYEEVAIVSSTGQGSAGALPEILSALQREAASVGANAVIHVRYDRGAQGASATGVAVRLK